MNMETEVCTGVWASRKRTFCFNKRKDNGKRVRVTITVEDEDAQDACGAEVVDGKLHIHIKSPYIEELHFSGGQVDIHASDVKRVHAQNGAAVTLNYCHSVQTLVANDVTLNNVNTICHCYSGCPNAHHTNGTGVRVHREQFNPFDDLVYSRAIEVPLSATVQLPSETQNDNKLPS